MVRIQENMTEPISQYDLEMLANFDLDSLNITLCNITIIEREDEANALCHLNMVKVWRNVKTEIISMFPVEVVEWKENVWDKLGLIKYPLPSGLMRLELGFYILYSVLFCSVLYGDSSPVHYGPPGVDFTRKTFFHGFWRSYTHFFRQFPGNSMI